MKKHKGFLHIGSRAWWVFICFIGLLFLGGCYNYTYNHDGSSNRHVMDSQRKFFMNRIPDYHPKKNTKGTKRAQDAEAKLKQKIQDRGN